MRKFVMAIGLLTAMGVALLAAAQSPPRGERIAVALYEFRSAVPEVQIGAATEMFVTALVRTGAFAVVERQRLNDGVMRERALQQSGYTAAPAAGQLAGARYVFEVVISEASRSGGDNANSVRIGGMTVGTGSGTDTIGIDVRIVDVQSGVVVDAVNATRDIDASTRQVSGVGNLLGALLGRAPKIDVDADHRAQRKEGVDRALRAVIEAAVADLTKRLTRE